MSIRGAYRFVVVLGLAALAGGCGNSSASPEPRPAATNAIPACRAGASWKEGGAQKIALACSPAGHPPAEALVGYAFPGGTSCVSAYVGRMDEPLDELCETSPSRWTVQCEAQGCVHFFEHGRKQTVLDGPVTGAATSVRVSAAGRPLQAGVLFAAVHGRLQRAIDAKEPFGFFVVSIPSCVESSSVRVEMLGAGGRRIGSADPWDVATKPCPPGGG